MILVDASVWVDHLRRGNAQLVQRLDEGAVLMHPFIIGELACAQLRGRARSEILELLGAMPALAPVSHDEALHFLHANRLAGQGIGWLDVHLLAAATVADVPLWTLDRRLADAHERIRGR